MQSHASAPCVSSLSSMHIHYETCCFCSYTCSAFATTYNLLCICHNIQPALHLPQHTEAAGCSCAQGVEHNSEAALYAVSQGRGRSAGCANLTAAETIAAQRCLRNPACSKALGHAGFCDNSKLASAMRHNSLAGLAAAAEQASNGSPGDAPANQHFLHIPTI